MKPVVHALKILSVFVLIGPLVGLVAFSGGVSLLGWFSGPPDAVWLGPFFLLYGILFAHFIGGVWALMAGCVAALVSWHLKRVDFWIGPASGLFTFVLAALSGNAQLPQPSGSPVGVEIAAISHWALVVVLFTHVAAATVAWLMARHFARV